MKLNHKTRGLVLAAAAAGVFALAPMVSHADAGQAKSGACFGVNACKGKSSCKTADNGCKGQNACKGKGFIEEVSPETCTQLDGTFRTYEDVLREQKSH